MLCLHFDHLVSKRHDLVQRKTSGVLKIYQEEATCSSTLMRRFDRNKWNGCSHASFSCFLNQPQIPEIEVEERVRM